MPPIPVHIDAPIRRNEAQGVTPQTAVAESPAAGDGVTAPVSNAATTTTAASQSPEHRPARPAQAAVPAPTAYLSRPAPEPTRTTSVAQQNGPPPPQPGAVPSPFGQEAPSNLPPPPRAGEGTQGTNFTGALNTMHVPPPPGPQQIQSNYAPTHSTSTYQPPASGAARSTTIDYGPVSGAGDYDNRRVSSEHPSGYVQNQYAQEMPAAQRASLEAETRRESIAAQLGLGSDGGFSAGGQDSGIGGGDGKTSAYWDVAKGWMNKAGSALAETEEAVWKRINGR